MTLILLYCAAFSFIVRVHRYADQHARSFPHLSIFVILCGLLWLVSQAQHCCPARLQFYFSCFRIQMRAGVHCVIMMFLLALRKPRSLHSRQSDHEYVGCELPMYFFFSDFTMTLTTRMRHPNPPVTCNNHWLALKLVRTDSSTSEAPTVSLNSYFHAPKWRQIIMRAGPIRI
jgi:hypothetical protein